MSEIQPQKQDNQINQIIDFLRYPEHNKLLGLSLTDRHISYVLSHLGRLFVKDFKILSILPQKIILLSRNYYCSTGEGDYILVRIESHNKFRHDKAYRIKTYSKLSDTIRSLPFKGNYRVLVLYIDNRSFSLLEPWDLESQMTPNIHQTRNMKFYQDSTIRQKPKSIDHKQAGTLLHSLMEFYISGNGWVKCDSIVKQIHASNLIYNPLYAIHTVNYIIGLELVKGGYDIISTEKLLEITNLLGDDYANFNRLDLVLRNQNKVLVIDWKFSCEKAGQYMKGYKNKVQKYLTLVKKYYRCEVQFHLYCIHAKDNGFMCDFSTQTVHKRISNIEIKGSCNDDDELWVIQSQQLNKQKVKDKQSGMQSQLIQSLMIEQYNLDIQNIKQNRKEGSKRKRQVQQMEQIKQIETKYLKYVKENSQILSNKSDHNQEQQKLCQIKQIKFQLSPQQLEEFCIDDQIHKHIDEEIEKQMMPKETMMVENLLKNIHPNQNQNIDLNQNMRSDPDPTINQQDRIQAKLLYQCQIKVKQPIVPQQLNNHNAYINYDGEYSISFQQRKLGSQSPTAAIQDHAKDVHPEEQNEDDQVLMITEQHFKQTTSSVKKPASLLTKNANGSKKGLKERGIRGMEIGISSLQVGSKTKTKRKKDQLVIDLEEKIVIQLD